MLTTLFESEVLEVCLLGMPEGRNKSKIRASEVLQVLRKSNPAYDIVTANRTAAAIRNVFPVYKNRRSRTKNFKICRSAAESYRSGNRLLLRPLEDAAAGRIGVAVEIGRQVQRSQTSRFWKTRPWSVQFRKLRWERVLVKIDDIDGDVLRLYVPQWNPELRTHISISALPQGVRPSIEIGQWLLAKAQVKSECPSGLRLRDFEPSPEPDPNDGLA